MSKIKKRKNKINLKNLFFKLNLKNNKKKNQFYKIILLKILKIFKIVKISMRIY